jgi:hypothetical protein
MKLLTKKIESKLPGMAKGAEGDDAVAHVKFFTPDSNWTWFATEYDPDEQMFFGLVIGLETELGYFSLQQLTESRGPLGMAIERDTHYQPKTLGEIRELIFRHAGQR